MHHVGYQAYLVRFLSTTKTAAGASAAYRGVVAALLIVGCAGEEPSGGSGDNTASSSQKPSTTGRPSVEPPTAAESAPSESSTPAVATPEPDTTPTETSPTATPAVKTADPNATGSFFGRIVLEGDIPELMPLAKAGDENLKDREVCGLADVPDESLVVGEENGIANVFVFLRRAPKGYEVTVPTEPVVLDQKGCVFTPHAAVIQAGQQVVVKSSDGVQHNVHTFPLRNQGANIMIKPNSQDGAPLDYTKAESGPIEVKCDIHSWMSSYHLVLDHPFMAVTDANGNFRIDGLPGGDYEFRVWHESGGLLEREYAYAVDGEDEAVELKYAADRFDL